MSVVWDIPVGTITTRRAVASKFGGALYGGIEPSTTTPNIMIFTDPEVGERNGYSFDGWDPTDPEVFYFTGDGRHGDQKLWKRNLSIFDHASRGKVLRLFQAPPGQRAGTKQQTYLGPFRIDSAEPFRREDAPGADGILRSVIVFRLVADGETTRGTGTTAPAPADRPTVRRVPLEPNNTPEVERAGAGTVVAVRREWDLVNRFVVGLLADGHDVERLEVRPPGHAGSLWTDPFDFTTNTLYEAKGATTRDTVRTAIGQLLDYRRFIESVPTCAVLLPVRPPQDLVELIHSCGFTLVYEDGKTFTTESPSPVPA